MYLYGALLSMYLYGALFSSYTDEEHACLTLDSGSQFGAVCPETGHYVFLVCRCLNALLDDEGITELGKGPRIPKPFDINYQSATG